MTSMFISNDYVEFISFKLDAIKLVVLLEGELEWLIEHESSWFRHEDKP